MSDVVKFSIDGRECMAGKGTYLLAAAKENGVYIPSLCNIEGLKPRGACRMCSVKVNGKFMTACTTPVSDGMEVVSETDEINDIRKAIVEMLFAEGNHFCPACERSGSCDLQALAYRFRVTVPRYLYHFPVRAVEASNAKLIKDHNRCILCKRCIRAIKNEDGKSLFAFKRRAHRVEINIDTTLARDISDDLARKAAEICPVGALLLRDVAYEIPIGNRVYDKTQIGDSIEQSVR
jgi:[NiFe] hydrogenase diaphorase moiety small subunit